MPRRSDIACARTDYRTGFVRDLDRRSLRADRCRELAQLLAAEFLLIFQCCGDAVEQRPAGLQAAPDVAVGSVDELIDLFVLLGRRRGRPAQEAVGPQAG